MIKKDIGTTIECTIVDYNGKVQKFSMLDSAAYLTPGNIIDMFGHLLLGMGYDKESIGDYIYSENFGQIGDYDDEPIAGADN